MATGMFRELGMPFYLAVTLLEHGEWLESQGRPEEAVPRLTEARARPSNADLVAE